MHPFFVVAMRLAAIVTFAAGPARAVTGQCGQPFTTGAKPKASDALYILKGAVQLVPCAFCLCDLNGNGTVTSADSLLDLKTVVGQPATLSCPPCDVTTTTLEECPDAAGLDDIDFIEKYSCAEPKNNPQACVDSNVSDTIHFDYKGGGVYEIHDVPDTGFVYSGTLECRTFTWSAVEPGEYTENGVWEFNANLTSFSGGSTYDAIDNSYSGACNETGKKSPSSPPDTPPIGQCP